MSRSKRAALVSGVFSIISSLSAFGQGAETAARQSITVLCDDNYAPYAFRDADGTMQGILVDQWRSWERTTGVQVRLIGLPWAEALRQFNSGIGDVIDTIFVTGERALIYTFSAPYATIQVPVFMHRSISGIARAGDLRGFKVAAKEGDAAVSELASRGVSTISLYPSYEDIVEAAARNDIRIFCIDAPPAYYYLYKRGIDADFRIAFILNEGAFHRAVRKGDEAILRLVERGFASISRSAMEGIDRKWLGSELQRRINPMIVGVVAAGVALLIIILVGISWDLRRRVARATESLHEKVILLEASEARNRAFISVLPDIIFTLDRRGTFIDSSTVKKEKLAFPPEAFIGKRMGEVGFPDGIVAGFMQELALAIDGNSIRSYEYSLPGDSGMMQFEGRIVPLAGDQAILVIRDITELKRQEQLLRSSLMEKEVLLKEIHHRVKNNMQVISSLIQLQSYSLRDEFDRELLHETQARINAMAAIHELLYQSPDLSSVDAGEYIGSVIEELSQGYDASGIRCIAETVKLGLDEAMPLGLLCNELLMNSIKYAYASGEKGRVDVRLGLDGSMVVLSVEDYGKGLAPGVDPLTSASMGFTLVRSLSEQLGGTLSFGTASGFRAELRFPLRTAAVSS